MQPLNYVPFLDLSCALPNRRLPTLSVLPVQFDYDNGVGSKVDRFSIDLYTSDGTGDCGTFVTSICDKESIGCKDSSEFHLKQSNLFRVLMENMKTEICDKKPKNQ